MSLQTTANNLRDQARIVGVGPFVVVALAVVVRRYRWLIVAAGVAWALANLLFASRDVHATVTVEDPTISYRMGTG
jgi:hypothetical protein